MQEKLPKIINRIPKDYEAELKKEKDEIIQHAKAEKQVSAKESVKYAILYGIAMAVFGVGICALSKSTRIGVYIVVGTVMLAVGAMIGIFSSAQKKKNDSDRLGEFMAYKTKSHTFKKNKFMMECLKDGSNVSAFSMTDSEVFVRFNYNGKNYCTIIPYEPTYEEDLPEDVIVFYADHVEGRTSSVSQNGVYGTTDLFGTKNLEGIENA